MSPTVIMTGGARGIGLAATQFLLEEGAEVVVVHRSDTTELSELAKKYPKTLRTVLGDLAQPDVIKRTIEEALKFSDHVDAVVFNASANPGVGLVTELPLEDWYKTFEVNVFGVVRFLQALFPVMKDGARTIIVSSLAAEIGAVAAGPYAASKAAANSLNRTLAAERPNQIFVALHPGGVRTKMQNDFATRASKHLSDELKSRLFDGLLEPEVPGRVIANLVQRAPLELSGKYFHWDAPEMVAL